ncbi:MAG: ribosome silencing factor [Eubacterium sp.]|nr:ribosome silencing factor [Eubacterium sp.]
MLESKEMIDIAVAAMQDKKGMDILSLHIGPLSPICDDFLIVSGGSRSQVDALIDGVEEALGRAGAELKAREGTPESGWILLDYSDIVIHIFTVEMREFYGLEHTWRDAECVRY